LPRYHAVAQGLREMRDGPVETEIDGTIRVSGEIKDSEETA